jgi:hypothetical protein
VVAFLSLLIVKTSAGNHGSSYSIPCWTIGTIAAGANPKEVAARAGHASVSFTLDRYGHLYPEADSALRDRLDTLCGTAQSTPNGTVARLPRRPRRGPSVAPGDHGDDESAADDAPTTL